MYVPVCGCWCTRPVCWQEPLCRFLRPQVVGQSSGGRRVYGFGGGTLWVFLYMQVGNISWKGHRCLLEKPTQTDQDPPHFHCLSPGMAWEPARPGPPLGRPNLEARCYGFNVYTLACLLSFYLGVFKTQM